MIVVTSHYKSGTSFNLKLQNFQCRRQIPTSLCRKMNIQIPRFPYALATLEIPYFHTKMDVLDGAAGHNSNSMQLLDPKTQRRINKFGMSGQ